MAGNLEGKSCLVTGSTSGIGKEIALGLAILGATVVLVGRSREKCESAIQEIETRVNDCKISYLVSDLSSQSSVRHLAKQYAANHRRLDVLVNNAGIFQARRNTTVDSVEYTFAVNHLAPFLLTNLLVDLLKASAPSRVITTSSIAHRGARIDFDDLQFERRKYSGIKAYGQSKLANILFTKQLALRLESAGVTANCFHPGAVRTGLVRGNSNPWYYRLIWALGGSFFSSPEKGADTAIYLASSPEVENTSGRYFMKRKPVKPSASGESNESAIRLWNESEKLTGI